MEVRQIDPDRMILEASASEFGSLYAAAVEAVDRNIDRNGGATALIEAYGDFMAARRGIQPLVVTGQGDTRRAWPHHVGTSATRELTGGATPARCRLELAGLSLVPVTPL
jgi:hypothetical protein